MALNDTKGAGLADRLRTAAEAKRALLAKFKPRPAVADPLFDARGAEAAAELKAVRAERQAARTVRKAAVDAVVAETAAAAGQRVERERKAPTEAEAKDRRDARYAARKSRL